MLNERQESSRCNFFRPSKISIGKLPCTLEDYNVWRYGLPLSYNEDSYMRFYEPQYPTTCFGQENELEIVPQTQDDTPIFSPIPSPTQFSSPVPSTMSTSFVENQHYEQQEDDDMESDQDNKESSSDESDNERISVDENESMCTQLSIQEEATSTNNIQEKEQATSTEDSIKEKTTTKQKTPKTKKRRGRPYKVLPSYQQVLKKQRKHQQENELHNSSTNKKQFDQEEDIMTPSPSSNPSLNRQMATHAVKEIYQSYEIHKVSNLEDETFGNIFLQTYRTKSYEIVLAVALNVCGLLLRNHIKNTSRTLQMLNLTNEKVMGSLTSHCKALSGQRSCKVWMLTALGVQHIIQHFRKKNKYHAYLKYLETKLLPMLTLQPITSA